MNNIVQIIKQRRKAQGITQAQLAKRIGITTRAYQTIEEGGGKIDRLIDICSALELNVLLIPRENILA